MRKLRTVNTPAALQPTNFEKMYGWNTTTRKPEKKPEDAGRAYISHDGVKHAPSARGRRGTYFGTFTVDETDKAIKEARAGAKAGQLHGGNRGTVPKQVCPCTPAVTVAHM